MPSATSFELSDLRATLVLMTRDAAQNTRLPSYLKVGLGQEIGHWGKKSVQDFLDSKMISRALGYQCYAPPSQVGSRWGCNREFEQGKYPVPSTGAVSFVSS